MNCFLSRSSSKNHNNNNNNANQASNLDNIVTEKKGLSFREKIKLNLNRKSSTEQPLSQSSESQVPKTDRPISQNDLEMVDDNSFSVSAPNSPKRVQDNPEQTTPTRERRSSSYIKALEEVNIKVREIRQVREQEKVARELLRQQEDTNYT